MMNRSIGKTRAVHDWILEQLSKKVISAMELTEDLLEIPDNVFKTERLIIIEDPYFSKYVYVGIHKTLKRKLVAFITDPKRFIVIDQSILEKDQDYFIEEIGKELIMKKPKS